MRSLVLSACTWLLLAPVGGKQLMVILLDGFRWDYFDLHTSDLPGFRWIIDNGVKADWLTPSFPTLTYPNLYTIITGLHPETHGFIGNNMWDEFASEEFQFGFNDESQNAHWWDGGEPIWNTAVLQGKTAYIYNWLGCDITIRGMQPTYCDVYSDYQSPPHVLQTKMANEMKDALDRLETREADLAMIYFEPSDFEAHLRGSNSPEVRDIIRWLDAKIENLIQEFKKRGLDKEVNLLVISDHGMIDIAEDRIIDISQALSEEECERIADFGPVTNIWPKKGAERQVYDKLRKFSPKMKVYLKRKIPERWRYMKHYRVSPILCVADPGWMIVTKQDGYPISIRNVKYSGYHGYDNNEESMRGIFLGYGPNFKSGHRVEPFDNIHLYTIMCNLLNLEPAPNNGSWEKVKGIYRQSPYEHERPALTTVIIGLIIATFAVTVFLTRRNKVKNA